jgi:hypothetical protein
MWVEPDMRVGPVSTSNGDLFTDFWGHDAELRGHYGGRSKRKEDDGRLTPLRGLIALQADSSVVPEDDALKPPWMLSDVMGQLLKSMPGLAENLAESAQEKVNLAIPQSEPDNRAAFQGMSVSSSKPWSTSQSNKPWLRSESVKEILEAVTGQPPERQKLVCGVSGTLFDDSKTLCEYDIGHGALLLFSLKRKPGQPQLSTPSVKDIQDRVDGFVRLNSCRNEWMKHGDLAIEHLPDWDSTAAAPLDLEPPPEIYWKNYQPLSDNNIFDVVGQIRKRTFSKKSMRRTMLAPVKVSIDTDGRVRTEA